MPSDSSTLRMIDLIYQAASEPSHWFEFVSELSKSYGGAPVALGMKLFGPVESHHHFAAGLRGAAGPELLEHFVTGLPFDPASMSEFTDRFSTIDIIFPELELEDTDFYRQWMKPNKLAAVWPISHVVTLDGEHAPVVLTVFRREGGGAFTPEELAIGNDLVPHLSRALQIYDDLSALHRSRKTLDDVIDRLRIGVILTDADRRPVLMNRSAQMMIEIGDHIELKDGRIHASGKSDDDLLQSTLEGAKHGDPWRAIRLGEDATHKHGLQILVNPLTSAPPAVQVRDAVAALFLSGPETFSGLSLRYLRRLYDLTAAEAELVAQLAGGASLEEAAEGRNVSVNTARSQLKRAFAKTGCHSQSEIVQLILKCISSIRET